MAAMLHDNRLFFQWEKMFFLMQNIFIVLAMQHGCYAKSLFTRERPA